MVSTVVMLRYLKTLSVSARLWWLAGAFSFIVFADNLAEMVLHGQRLRAEKEQQLVQLVDAAHSILRHLDGEARAGRLSDAEARQLAINTLRPLRHSGQEYFWINNLEQPLPRIVMHATAPALEGSTPDSGIFRSATSSRSGRQGPYQNLDGKNVFVAMREVVNSPSGDGFVTYVWNKPDAVGGITDERFPKLSYVRAFEPWGWIIGTGIYMDQFEAAYWREVRFNLLKFVVWLLIFGFVVWVILRTIIRPLRALQETIDEQRMHPDSAVSLPADSPQELGNLAKSFQLLINERQQSRQALQDSLDQLKLAGCAIAEMSEGVLVTDADGKILSVNRAFTRITGYSAAEAVGQASNLLKSGRHDRDFYHALWTQLATEGSWSGEIWCRSKHGQIYPEWLSISTSHDAAGQVSNYIGVFSDISERKRNEADLRVAATAFEAQGRMFITDARGVILRVNQAFTEVTGYTAAEAIGETPRLLSSGRHDAAFYAAMRLRIEETGAWQGEIWNRRKNGEVFPEWLTITAVTDSTGKVSHHVSTLTDITQRKAAESEIKNLAYFDPLTRLPNRRLLLDRLQHALSLSAGSGRAGALMFIDLDNFKVLNDTLGHDKGDLLLQDVARRLVGAVREGDTVARLGGDEFVVLLESLSTQIDDATIQTGIVGEKILAALNCPYDLDGHKYHSSPSIGATLFVGHQYSIEELLKRADLAMYQSKGAGRNTFSFFDPELQSIISTRAVLEADLREAVRHHQFFLDYQAQVDGSGQLIGAEALVRWRHPTRGIVAPGEFIPLAEETGLILPLGHWVLEAACHQLAKWAPDPVLGKLFLAVNVSAAQYHQAGFAAEVLAALRTAGADPCRLKLELTESMLLNDPEDIIAKMATLKAKGVGFALDDFGTGYSSLSYLKRLPIDQLKIDRSFVRDLLTDPSDKAIAKTIITLAKTLGLSVIAEGVETEAQRDCLASQGCHCYQGYLFGRPGPAEALLGNVFRAAGVLLQNKC